MKLLQKILFVMMIGLVIGNADVKGMHPPALPVATPIAGVNVLDFDTIATIAAGPVAATVIPLSLQPKIYEPVGYNVAGPNNLRYVYFNVLTPAGGAIPGNGAFQHAAVLAAADPNLAGGFNIFFPADGSQPTTANAVNYALANIDNRENSPITDWYMKMFGLIPFQNSGVPVNDYMKSGWNDNATATQAIITFNNDACTGIANGNNHNFCTMVNGGHAHKVADPNNPAAQISRIALFRREFRKIASTAVGRVLLYRVLIEIRRHVANNVGSAENQAFVGNTLGTLNNDRCRSIEIAYDGEGLLGGFGFSIWTEK